MNSKAIGLKILFFCELVGALRILLFEIPVLIDRVGKSAAASLSGDERFLNIVFLLSVFYLFAAVAGIGKNKFWRPLQYLCAAVAVLLTLDLYRFVQQAKDVFQAGYLIPLMFSLIAAWFVFISRKCSLEKDKEMKKVLIVDDDLSIHKMLEPILTSNGFGVVSAKTGEEGLQMAQTHKPDIIILDVILPGIKGRAVCVQIKKNPALKDIPVLFLTSKDSPDDVQAELEAGGIGHLTKPINPQYLVAQIKRVLG